VGHTSRAILLLVGLAALPAHADVQEFYVATVHLDGSTSTKGDGSHPAEPFPAQEIPSGGGLIRKSPNAEGAWSIRAFVFVPQQLVVRQGDEVVLHFVGVQGPSHRIEVVGQGPAFELRRGEVRTIRFQAAEPGVTAFRSIDRAPTMQGQILVLAKP